MSNNYPLPINWTIQLTTEGTEIHGALSVSISGHSKSEATFKLLEQFKTLGLKEKHVRSVKPKSYLPPEIALSVRQPWAWAIIYAGKDIENRSTPAISRGLVDPGRIAIHAAQTMTQADYRAAARFIKHNAGIDVPRPDKLLRGCLIGSVTVIRVVNDSVSPWFMGPRGLVLRDPRPYTPKGKTTGMLGYFKHSETTDPLPEPRPWEINYDKPSRQSSLL